jgi:hypothetical protein
VKPRASAQASWPAPMKPTLMAAGSRLPSAAGTREREPGDAAKGKGGAHGRRAGEGAGCGGGRGVRGRARGAGRSA